MRHETSVLTCALGEVANVSKNGMCVRTFAGWRGGGETITIELCSPRDELTLSARVVRSKPLPGGRSELGLEFLNIDQQTQEAVERLAMHGTTRSGGTERFADQAERLRQLSVTLKMPNHYAVLGVRPGATAQDIQKAFRALARQFHPDLNKDPEAETRFCAINAAYAILNDPEKRASYDVAAGFVRAA